MKYFYTLFIIVLAFLPHTVHAARLTLVQKTDVTSGRVTIDVMADPEGESINAIAGDVSIPSELLSVASISTVGGVAPLWLTKPEVSSEKELDTRTRVEFEGIFPGGFTGGRSPYYAGTEAGKLFSVTLQPEKAGDAVVLLENIDIRLNDGQATRVPEDPDVLSFTIPDVASLPKTEQSAPVASHEVPNANIETFLTKDQNTDSDAWVLMIHDDTNTATLKQYSVAESKSAAPDDVYFYEWKKVTFPYKLDYQSRNRFIHIKAEYDDGSYSYTTIQPVQKSDDTTAIWRILILIAIALLVGYVLIQKYRTKK
jgi:hypothetical protein